MIKIGKAPPLEERIKELRAEIDSFIDDRVVHMKAESPGVPEGVLRNLLIARAPDCECRAYQIIRDNDEKAKPK